MCSGIKRGDQAGPALTGSSSTWSGHGDLQPLLAQLQAIEGVTIPVVASSGTTGDHQARADIGAYGVMVPWIGGRAGAGGGRARRPPDIRGIAGSLRAIWTARRRY
jgi:hypothetical protein